MKANDTKWRKKPSLTRLRKYIVNGNTLNSKEGLKILKNARN